MSIHGKQSRQTMGTHDYMMVMEPNGAEYRKRTPASTANAPPSRSGLLLDEAEARK